MGIGRRGKGGNINANERIKMINNFIRRSKENSFKNNLEELFGFLEKIIRIDLDLKSARIYSITCLLRNAKELIITTRISDPSHLRTEERK